jgi:hypothetical protein
MEDNISIEEFGMNIGQDKLWIPALRVYAGNEARPMADWKSKLEELKVKKEIKKESE